MRCHTNSNDNHRVLWRVTKILGALLVCYLFLQLLKYSLLATVVTVLPAGFATIMLIVRRVMADYKYRHPRAFRLLLVMVGILGIFVFIVPCLQLTEWGYWETEGMITPAYFFFGCALVTAGIFFWLLIKYKKYIEVGKEKASRPYALAMAFCVALFFGQGLASISAYQNIEQEKWETSREEIQIVHICPNCQKTQT